MNFCTEKGKDHIFCPAGCQRGFELVELSILMIEWKLGNVQLVSKFSDIQSSDTGCTKHAILRTILLRTSFWKINKDLS